VPQQAKLRLFADKRDVDNKDSCMMGTLKMQDWKKQDWN